MANKKEKSITASSSTFQSQRHAFSYNQGVSYKSKDDLIAQYTEKRKQSFIKGQKLFREVKKNSQDKVSLIIARDHEKNTLNIEYQDKVSKVKIQLDKINMLDKINFHKQSSCVIYIDLL